MAVCVASGSAKSNQGGRKLEADNLILPRGRRRGFFCLCGHPDPRGRTTFCRGMYLARQATSKRTPQANQSLEQISGWPGPFMQSRNRFGSETPRRACRQDAASQKPILIRPWAKAVSRRPTSRLLTSSDRSMSRASNSHPTHCPALIQRRIVRIPPVWFHTTRSRSLRCRSWCRIT